MSEHTFFSLHTLPTSLLSMVNNLSSKLFTTNPKMLYFYVLSFIQSILINPVTISVYSNCTVGNIFDY